MKIGSLIIMKASNLPYYEKAHKLARCLTLNDIELILSGKKHLHGNPIRKPKKVMAELAGLS